MRFERAIYHDSKRFERDEREVSEQQGLNVTLVTVGDRLVSTVTLSQYEHPECRVPYKAAWSDSQLHAGLPAHDGNNSSVTGS